MKHPTLREQLREEAVIKWIDGSDELEEFCDWLISETAARFGAAPADPPKPPTPQSERAGLVRKAFAAWPGWKRTKDHRGEWGPLVPTFEGGFNAGFEAGEAQARREGYEQGIKDAADAVEKLNVGSASRSLQRHKNQAVAIILGLASEPGK